MRKFQFLLLYILILLTRVAAQDNVNEGRITEHSVFSLIAVGGLLTLTYFVRKNRLRDTSEE